ncbi:L-2-amino-thiazoline-4-carboxylic acid hydrolase [Clostridium tagluense]|uniref:L-2-amino-thiazoline-4-carboxylic acid hydrolase n=1 Tax=Clostridium tagluense TaxID=360422 RepID=UPI001C6DE914|nr:L-2-amino-thiazoline-4-carboxylic acid hydrolase [Clostridium tagluense]MBW9159598.1 L-2-amino-thiazoline-4-carboxylic acid hydrolase [Clostridium tagluense]WLC63604.1 L-2-amino-thiazoline-4-carboxylic acid hydrolase [Clostridium tagluense]
MENHIIENEVKSLFCHELYNFQVERATKIVEHLTTALGDDVVKSIQEINVDWKEPLKMYMENTVMIIEKLKELYGDKVIEILKEHTANDALKRGQDMSANTGATLDDFLKIFGKGKLVCKSQSEAVLRCEGCLVSKVARELGVENIMYYLHCYGDPYYAKGINPNISCKHNKTFMQGDDCCEYLITMKVNKD